MTYSAALRATKAAGAHILCDEEERAVGRELDLDDGPIAVFANGVIVGGVIVGDVIHSVGIREVDQNDAGSEVLVAGLVPRRYDSESATVGRERDAAVIEVAMCDLSGFGCLKYSIGHTGGGWR